MVNKKKIAILTTKLKLTHKKKQMKKQEHTNYCKRDKGKKKE